MAADRAARLAEQQAADAVVVARERLHPRELGGAGRRQHAAHDHVAGFALGVAANHLNRAAGAHVSRLPR